MLSNIQGYNTMLFHEIYPSFEVFLNGKTEEDVKLILGYNDIPEFNTLSNVDNLKIIYLLLLSRYGNSPIANNDINQFSLKVFGTIYQYGPTWERKKKIQEDLRDITSEGVLEGSKAIHNHAYNPDTLPSTDTLEELNFINDQNTTNYKRSKIEGNMALWDVLKDDVDRYFMDKFSKLFLQIVRPINPYYYVTEGDN